MIKLIATDVDGTLVKDGTLLIDPEYMTVVSRLVDQGITRASILLSVPAASFPVNRSFSLRSRTACSTSPMAELSCAHRKRF